MNKQYEQIIAKFQALSSKKMLGLALDSREAAFVHFVEQNFVPNRECNSHVSQAFSLLP